MKKEIDFNQISKEELIKLYLKKIEAYDELEAKFYELEKEKNEALKKIEQYEMKLKISQYRKFGRKAETKIGEKIEETVFNEAEKEIEEEKKEVKKSGRKKGSQNFDKEYLEAHVVETIYLEPEGIEKLKEEEELIELESDVFYKTKVVPERIEVIKIIKKKYYNKKNNEFYQGINDDPFPHSICSADLATDIMIKKFMYGLPYYRQSEVIINDGLYISRQNLCNYQLRATSILEPMYEYLKKLLINTSTKVIYADETTLRVIESDKSKCYAWVYSTGFYDHPIYIYDFRESRTRENIIKFLDGFNGYLVTDKYGGYSKLEGIDNAYCWVHARRNFNDILQTINKGLWPSSVSYKIVRLIDELFKKEAEFKKRKLGPNRIQEERNKDEYLKSLNEIFTILHNTEPEKGSLLESAYNYILKDEDSFKTFLKDGHIELSNNISERAVKPFVIDRKNFLFSNTIEGARSSLIFFSLQQTARSNGLNPYEYIRDLINILYKDSSKETLDKLLPWNYSDNISKFIRK